MKVVAVINASRYVGKYLVEVTSQELEVIALGTEYPHGDMEFRVGVEVLVTPLWKRVCRINKAQSRLDTAAQSLRAVADLLGTIDVVVPPTAPEPATEGGAK